MTYPTHRGYPDIIDFRALSYRFFKKKKGLPVEELYQDFRASYEFLSLAIQSCHWVGKHKYERLSAVKETTEIFVGRTLDPNAFLIGAYLATGDRRLTKMKKTFDELAVKVPPFDRQRIEAAWTQHEADTEEENERKRAHCSSPLPF
jgi:hypothetical protein